MASISFPPADFLTKLGVDDFASAPLGVTGLVKPTAEGQGLLFAPGNDCRNWVSVPLQLIDQVELLGRVRCAGDDFPLVTLRFRAPESAEAQAFAAIATLLSTASSIPQSPWPQFFLTRVVGSEDLPDVEILTLPAYPSADAIPNLEELQVQIMAREDFDTVGGSGIDYGGAEACLAALHQVIIDAEIREELPWQPERTREYAEQIFSAQPVPVMNSPLSGSTLGQMVAAAGGGAVMAALLHPDVAHITLYFVLIGGTRIVVGAADGISIALRQGLSHLLLKWMGVSATVATSRKRKKAASRGGTASA
jgi:hypothetical protein